MKSTGQSLSPHYQVTLIFATFLAVTCQHLSAQTPPPVTPPIEIDVIVNVQTGADGTIVTKSVALIRNTIIEANKKLKQANIRLNVKTAKIDNTGNADGNSSMTKDERDAAEEKGKMELDQMVGSGKGMKIVICDQPDGPYTRPDGSMHPGSVSPGLAGHTARVVFVRPVRAPVTPIPPGGPKAPSPEVMTGTALAHEVAHALTLGAGHVINPGTPTTTPLVADGAGHVPNVTGAPQDNLMFPIPIPGFGPHGKLTPTQITEIRRRAGLLGQVMLQANIFLPTTRLRQESGGTHDSHGDTALAVTDLSKVTRWTASSIYDTTSDFLSWSKVAMRRFQILSSGLLQAGLRLDRQRFSSTTNPSNRACT